MKRIIETTRGKCMWNGSLLSCIVSLWATLIFVAAKISQKSVSYVLRYIEDVSIIAVFIFAIIVFIGVALGSYVAYTEKERRAKIASRELKNHENNTTRWVKISAYATFVVFGIQLVLSIFLLSVGTMVEVISGILTIFICGIAFYLGYAILKKREQWAFIVLIMLGAIKITSSFITALVLLGQIKLSVGILIYVSIILRTLSYVRVETHENKSEKT